MSNRLYLVFLSVLIIAGCVHLKGSFVTNKAPIKSISFFSFETNGQMPCTATLVTEMNSANAAALYSDRYDDLRNTNTVQEPFLGVLIMKEGSAGVDVKGGYFIDATGRVICRKLGDEDDGAWFYELDKPIVEYLKQGR